MTIDNAGRAANAPAIRRRRLAAELRQRREQAGLTIDEAAGKLEWSAAKISRIENAKVSVLPRDVKFLAGIYGIYDSSECEQLLDLARQARQKAWWHHYGVTIPAWLQPYAALEAEATSHRSYHPELVPDLLRTPAYHHAITGAAPGFDSHVAMLLPARQQRHADNGTPYLHAILGEAILHRPIGGPAVMAAQLTHLTQAGHRPGTTIQVLPFQVGAHPAMGAPFTLLSFDDPGDPDIAWTGPQHSPTCPVDPGDVQHYQHAFTRLQEMALPPDGSLALIEHVARELTRQSDHSRSADEPADHSLWSAYRNERQDLDHEAVTDN